MSLAVNWCLNKQFVQSRLSRLDHLEEFSPDILEKVVTLKFPFYNFPSNIP